MLINTYTLEVTSPPCDPGTERWSAFARFEPDISDVLPYLNSCLQGCIYDHTARVLTWRKEGHAVSIRPHEIAVSNLQDRAEAQAAVDEIVALVNQVWERRTEIEPNYQKRQRLNPLAIYKLLPGTNCRLCGEATCFIFATKLAVGTVTLAQCKPLDEASHQANREKLAAMLAEAA